MSLLRRSLTHGHTAYHEDGQCPEKLHFYGKKIRKTYIGFPGHCIKVRFNPTDDAWKHPYHMVILFGEGEEDFWFYNNEEEARGMAMLKNLRR